MKINPSPAFACVLLSCGLSNAAVVVPGYLPGDSNFSYQAIDIRTEGPLGRSITSASEAEAIVTAVGSTPAEALVPGAYYITANNTGFISTVDNGNLAGNHSVDQLSVADLDGEDMVVQYTAGIYFPAGDYSIYVNGDDGHSVSIPGVVFVNRFGNVSGTPADDQLLHEDPTPNSNQGAQFTVGAGGLVTTFEATWYERSGVEFFEVEFRTGFGTKGTGSDSEWDILREDSDESGIAINSTPFIPIPEPSGVILLALGSLLGLGIRRR